MPDGQIKSSPFLRKGRVMKRLKFLSAAVIVSVSVAAVTDAAAQKKADRAAALRLAELMPAPMEEWNAGKPRIEWLNGGGAARALYWTKKPGAGNYTITFEVRTRGLEYKKNLLSDRRRAARRGYTFLKIAGTVALVRKRLKKIEMRFWYKDRILILAKGKVPLERLEEHLKTVDYDKLAGIK